MCAAPVRSEDEAPPHVAAGLFGVPSLATLALYVVAVAWLTWPLVPAMATHLPGPSAIAEMDTLHSVWVLAWQSHALVDGEARLLDANVYHPAPRALLYHTLGLGTLPYFAPTFLATGDPVLATNLALLACIALAGFGVHRVVWTWTGSWVAGGVGGAALLLTPWVLWTWMPVRAVHFPLQYFPWIVALVALPGWTAARGVALVALVAAQCAVDLLYVAPAVVAPIAAVIAWRLVRPATRGAALRLAGATAVALALLAPLYAAYAAMRAASPALSARSAWGNPNDAPGPNLLDGFVLAGGPYADLRPLGVPSIVVPLLAVGLAAFLLAPRDARRRLARPWLHAGLWTAVGVLVSIRAVIWLGPPPAVVPSPLFAVAEWLVPDAVHALRGVFRLGVGALVGLALLAGLAFAACEPRLARRHRGAPALAALAIVAVMYARWPGRAGPYPLLEPPARDTPVMAALRRSSGPVLELPATTAPLATTQHARAMYRSIFHRRPLLNGYGSYWPAGFPERLALAARLPDPDAVEALRRQTGLAAILVHPDARRHADWLALAERGDGALALIARDGGDLLFEVRPAPSSATRLRR